VVYPTVVGPGYSSEQQNSAPEKDHFVKSAKIEFRASPSLGRSPESLFGIDGSAEGFRTSDGIAESTLPNYSGKPAGDDFTQLPLAMDQN
jgi:hypothetical protein